MFYELYEDLPYGGTWFDPDESAVVHIIDMGDVDREYHGAYLVEYGYVYFGDEKRIRDAARSSGLTEQEVPPGPPKGPKEWAPRYRPKPKPGDLFWIPAEPRVEALVRAWKRWKEGEGEVPFDELESEDKDAILQLADVVHGYAGMDEDHGTWVVDVSDQEGRETARRLRDKGYTVIGTKHAETGIWKALKRYDIKPR